MHLTAKLGIAPPAWTNDPSAPIGDDAALDAGLSESRLAGYSGIEAADGLPTSATQLVPLLKKHRLELASGRYAGTLLDGNLAGEKAKALPQLAQWRELGAACLVYSEAADTPRVRQIVAPRQRSVLDDAEMRAYGRRLTAFAEFCAGNGVPLAYRHRVGSVVETEHDIDRLMASTGDAVRLLFDTGHLTVAGADPLAVLERHGRRILHVHVQDVRPALRRQQARRRAGVRSAASASVYTVPGDGCIDFSKIVRRLADLGYEGWFVVEAGQAAAKPPLMEYARIGHSALSAHLIQAGYRVRNGSRAVARPDATSLALGA